MLICLKQKDWSKRGGVPATSTRRSDLLGRQFLITASTFPYSSKNSSAEHIHNLPTCLTLINTLIHIDKHTLTHWLIHSYSLSLSHTHTETCIKTWICSSEEFLELYGKVEAVVRNFLLRWSGQNLIFSAFNYLGKIFKLIVPMIFDLDRWNLVFR